MNGPLVVDGLVRRFPGTAEPTLRGVDLEVPAGGCVALLGPSGAGKSTVLRIVAGLDTPDGGRVLVGDRDLAGTPPERRRTVLVFQRARLFPYLSVLDNVAFPLAVSGRSRRTARADACRFLDLVGLAELAGRRPASLSGGQEQRVALARALAARPDVLLLDEPFSALDPELRGEMHDLLSELRAAVEPTILLVTHDRHEAGVVADTVALLLDGRILQHARVDDLYQRPSSLTAHRFLGGRNAVRGVVRNGAHHSALGTLDLPRQSSAMEGPAVLVIRHEAVEITAPGETGAQVHGTVLRVTPSGARELVEVDTPSGSIFVESVSGAGVRPGASVALLLPRDRRHVLPVDEPTSDQPVDVGVVPAERRP